MSETIRDMAEWLKDAPHKPTCALLNIAMTQAWHRAAHHPVAFAACEHPICVEWLRINEPSLEICTCGLDRLLAALAAPPVPDQGWQDIKTAPKDGTRIIGALIRDGVVWRVHDMKYNGLAFYTVNGRSLPPMTHWMPLPDPPMERER